MRIDSHKKDMIFSGFLILIIFGLPFGILAYDRHLAPKQVFSETKEFTLTGHTQRGWILGDVQAYDTISLWQQSDPIEKPLIEVSEGDTVILKLRSSDVTHGFSLKAFDIYIADGIEPGKTVFVSFTADKTGTFPFECNVFCGDIHQHMRGALVVKDLDT